MQSDVAHGSGKSRVGNATVITTMSDLVKTVSHKPIPIQPKSILRIAGTQRPSAKLIDRGTFCRLLARRYITNAAAILSGIGEEERRLSWLLEDCAGMLCQDPDAASEHSAAPNL